MVRKTIVSRACLCIVAASLLASSAPAQQGENPDLFPPVPPLTPPSTQPSEPQENSPRIYGDFAKLTLTPEQRQAIRNIQTDAKARIEKIEAEAEEKIATLLTHDQLNQLAEIDKERKAKAKKAYELRKQKEKADMLELAKRRKEEQDAATNR